MVVVGVALPLVFASEKELQARLAAILPLAAKGEVTAVRREMPVGRCIPDVLAVSAASLPPASLWPRNWSYRHACVVAALRQWRAVDVGTLAGLVHERETEAAAMVADLERSGAVVRTARGTVRLAPALRSVRTHITAIEAKLDRWQDALGQALEYRLFADRVVVAMDAGARRRLSAKVVAEFRRQGVALCTVDHDAVRFLSKGRATGAASAKREYVSASFFLARAQTLWMRR